MVDLYGKDKRNISLPSRLQPLNIEDSEMEDQKDKVVIINMQKAMYDIRIADLETRIKRLETRNQELLDTSNSTESRIDSTDLETADNIAQFNRQIFVETSKTDEYNKRMDMLNKRKAEEKTTHNRKQELMEKQFSNTRFELTSKIKFLNAKINTLEDYKVTKPSLHEKLRERNELMAEKDIEVARKLEDIEKKHNIDTEKLKNEMHTRLFELAGTFQIELSSNVAIPVHRLMRESILVKNELIQIANEYMLVKEKNRRKEHNFSLYEEEIKNGRADKFRYVIIAKIRRVLLNALREMHKEMSRRQDLYTLTSISYEDSLKLREDAKILADACATRLSKFEVLLHREQVKLGLAKYSRRKLKAVIRKLIDTLYDVKYVAACALKITGTGEDILEMGDTQLMSHLLDILSRPKLLMSATKVTSTKSVLRADHIYKIGDLEFEPKHINIDPQKLIKEKEPSELSTLKTLKNLGIDLFAESDDYDQMEYATKVTEDFEEEASNESTTSTQSFEEIPEMELKLMSENGSMSPEDETFEDVETGGE
ncbi:A-kinase anchor protein 9-like isoform X2 [Cephus cinctus]|uniref:Cilia- and flagella-associated protein 157 n=1 Tax=Cephus cinctus TaxID=211228 RepID=A0AAJ7RKN6_CEPCN|nr:A-kinase anchor protein 9-like isoform X2 [Cephus cinctus]